jgi:hypothetical protein
LSSREFLRLQRLFSFIPKSGSQVAQMVGIPALACCLAVSQLLTNCKASGIKGGRLPQVVAVGVQKDA